MAEIFRNPPKTYFSGLKRPPSYAFLLGDKRDILGQCPACPAVSRDTAGHRSKRDVPSVPDMSRFGGSFYCIANLHMHAQFNPSELILPPHFLERTR